MKHNSISRGYLVLALASTVLLMASTAVGNMLPPLTTSDNPGLESSTRPQASPQPTRGLHINQELLRRSVDPTVASVAHYSYLGCFFDPAATRLLDGKIIWNQADNNPAACQSLCSADGLPDFFGVENTRNCLCGSTLAVSAAAASLLSVTAAACSAACPGSAQALCGGYGYINMYAAATASAAVTVTVTQSRSTSTAGAAVSSTTGSTSSASPTGSSAAQGAARGGGGGGLSSGAAAGIGVGAAVAMALLLVGGFVILRRRKARRGMRAEELSPTNVSTSEPSRFHPKTDQMLVMELSAETAPSELPSRRN